jgi:hypothetical protein
LRHPVIAHGTARIAAISRLDDRDGAGHVRSQDPGSAPRNAAGSSTHNGAGATPKVAAGHGDPAVGATDRDGERLRREVEVLIARERASMLRQMDIRFEWLTAELSDRLVVIGNEVAAIRRQLAGEGAPEPSAAAT